MFLLVNTNCAHLVVQFSSHPVAECNELKHCDDIFENWVSVCWVGDRYGMTFFLSCPFPPLFSRGEGIRVEYIHIVWCILLHRKTVLQNYFFFNALCGKGNAKSYLALCSMSFWNEKEWLIFKVLPAVFLRGIALCHYFLEFWVAIPNASLSNLHWKGARVTLIMLSAPVC